MAATSGRGIITPGAHGAWCEECQDGINRTDAGTAADWARAHNTKRHGPEASKIVVVTV